MSKEAIKKRKRNVQFKEFTVILCVRTFLELAIDFSQSLLEYLCRQVRLGNQGLWVLNRWRNSCQNPESTIKVCSSCFEEGPGSSVPSVANLMASRYLYSSESKVPGEDERAPMKSACFSSKRPSRQDVGWGSCWKDWKWTTSSALIGQWFALKANKWFFTSLATLAFYSLRPPWSGATRSAWKKYL